MIYAHVGTYICDMKPKPQIMNRQAIVFTPNVLDTLRALPYEERLNVASAFASELLLGAGDAPDLTPSQEMVYTILRGFVERASAMYNRP